MTAELSGMVSTIQRFSIDDGPGIRTTVFLKGCPLRCPWCHNPETQNYFPEIFFRVTKCIGCGKCKESCPVNNAVLLNTEHRINRQLCIGCMKCVEACPAGALEQVGKTLTVSEVINEVKRDVPFYINSGGGITLSGGEPMAQPAFTAELLKEAKKIGINTCIETNGYAEKSAWEKVLPHLDLLLLDIKHTDPVTHQKFTGVGNEIILNNARELALKVNLIIRTPLIPGFNDTEPFIEELGQFANSAGIRSCHLIPYHEFGKNKYALLDRENDYYLIPRPLGEKSERFKKQLEKYGLQVMLV